jgi:hypothetical protein
MQKQGKATGSMVSASSIASKNEYWVEEKLKNKRQVFRISWKRMTVEKSFMSREEDRFK